MKRRTELKEIFREAGLRWTPQRQVIAEILDGCETHPTAEEIFREVRKRFPGMSRATVYNTMEALTAVGQVEEIQKPHGSRRYDPNPEPHHHLRCRSCGRIVDLPDGSLAALPKLPARLLSGFRVSGYRIEFHGSCPSCLGSRARAARPGPAPAGRRRD